MTPKFGIKDKVRLLPGLHSATNIATISGVTGELMGWEHDSLRFLLDSDNEAEFVITDVHSDDYTTRGFALVTVKSYTKKCKRNWWVPEVLFTKVHNDWLEDLDLAVQSC